MERMLPALPIERIEPALPMERMLPELPMERTLPALPTESTEKKLAREPMLPKLNRLYRLRALERPRIRAFYARCATRPGVATPALPRWRVRLGPLRPLAPRRRDGVGMVTYGAAMKVNEALTAATLRPKAERLLALSGEKIKALEATWDPSRGTPVYTVRGRYTSRGWTEWTQGFQFGSALLQFDATGDEEFLDIGRRRTLEVMASHVSHVGVHDHGFNNVSTYGTLWRLLREGRVPDGAPSGAPSGESLLVADTYNHRVKRIDLGLRESRSLVGAGAPAGYADGPGRTARFSEPGGLSYARGQIFVADTNNHRVRVVDLATGAVGTLEIDLSRRAHEPAP
jgi:NHL repeat